MIQMGVLFLQGLDPLLKRHCFLLDIADG